MKNFLQNNLQFTPNDSATLWATTEEIFEADDVEDDLELDNYCVSFDEYFKEAFHENRLLTLDDTRDYEIHLKRVYMVQKKI